jgi:aquaporin Z
MNCEVLPMHLGKRAIAEFLGTFWLTFAGCGSAVIAAAYPQLGIGFLGVALAFGLTVVTMAYAVGHISGAHFNPAITIGVWVGGRIPFRDVVPYVVFQVAGAIAAAAVLKIVAEGQPGFVLGGFASNGYGDLSPGHSIFFPAPSSRPFLLSFLCWSLWGQRRRGRRRASRRSRSGSP